MGNMDLAILLDEIEKTSAKAQQSMMIPAEVKRLLFIASQLLTELTEREINRNAKGE